MFAQPGLRVLEDLAGPADLVAWRPLNWQIDEMSGEP
jgi:hypothetical protein